MDLEFTGPVWYWKGPAPHHFVTVPEEHCALIHSTAAAVSYGWGMIPVSVQIGRTRWTTSLFPKDGRYIVPLKLAARTSESLSEGDTITIRLHIDI